MKRHCPGAASVVLAVLWLLASGLLPLGCQDCAVSQGQQGPAQLPAHPRRLAAKPTCPTGMNWIDEARRCCPQCPPGTYLKNPCSKHGNDSDCAACPDGTYHSQPNTRTKCHVCYECDHHGELAVPRAALCCAMLYHPAHPHTCSFPERAEQLLGHQQRRLWLQAWPLPQLPERALQRILLQQVPALPGEAGPAALLRHAGHAVRQLQAQLLRQGQRVPAVPHEHPGDVRRGVPAGVRRQRPRLGAAVPSAGPDCAPLHGRLRHLQEEVAPAQDPGGQPPPHSPTPGLPQPHGLHILPHPGGCSDGDSAVPGL